MSIMKLDTLKGGSLYPDGETINVVGEYAWTLSPPAQKDGFDPRSDAPRIILTEFEQDLSTLYSQLFYWYRQVKDMAQQGARETVNPYANLYHAITTKTTYTLPYFETYDHFINQTWEKTKGLMDYPIANTILNLAANAAKMFQLAPGTAVNQPQVWSGSGYASYTIRFLLFNTLTDIAYKQNLKFKNRIQMSTLHDQRTAILASPPAIFEVRIPGIRWCPAAVISSLTVDNIGQMNMINGVVVPDAWAFTIQVTELLQESRQILLDGITGSRVTATITDKQPPITFEGGGGSGGRVGGGGGGTVSSGGGNVSSGVGGGGSGL